MKKAIIFVLLCLWANLPIFSQAIIYSGQVVSLDTETPISLANVVLLTQDSTFIEGGVTDENGKYSITLPSGKLPHLIKITCIGYETLFQPVDSLSQQNAVLALRTHTSLLNEVTVMGKQRAFSLKNGALVANVSSTPALKNSGSVDNLLNSIPFVQGSAGNYSVLGTGGSATLYLDGQKIQDPDILQRLRSQDIASIEVVNTPGVQYKASTKSVIKINTIKKQLNTSISASQYAQLQNRLSTYTGVNIAHNSKKAYWNFNLGYSHTAISNQNSDYYSLHNNEGHLAETSSTSDITSLNDNIIGGFSVNISTAPKANLGLASNFNIGKSKFDISSSGLRHTENGQEILNTPVSSQLDLRPYKSASNIYFNGNIGNTVVNLTNEILFGGDNKNFTYEEKRTSSVVTTTGRQRYIMNSAMLSFQTPLKNIMLGYGGEITLSYNRNNLSKNEQGISTEVINSDVKNRQNLGAAYIDVRTQWKYLSVYAGLRYEYESSSYVQDETTVKFHQPSPHFLSPTLSFSYSGKTARVMMSYRRSIDRPAYSSINNFILIENKYIYQQGNPYLINQTNDVFQLMGSHKNVSFNASYNYIQNTATTALVRYDSDDNVILKQIINLPHYSMIYSSLYWRATYGRYTPSIGANFQKQFLTYLGKDYNRPLFKISMEHYLEIGKNWRSGAYISYTSRNTSLLRDISARWNYRLMLSKSIKNFNIDLNLQNLFLDNKLTRVREMSGIVSREIEAQDFSGININISYRFNTVKAGYRNNHSSNESKRF